MAQNIKFNITFIDQFSKVGRNLKKNLDKGSRAMKKFGNQSKIAGEKLKSVSKQMGGFGRKARGMGRGLTLTLTAPLIAAVGWMVKTAATSEEMESKLQASFGGSSDTIREWSNKWAKDANRGIMDSRQLAANAGAMMDSMFPDKAVLAQKAIKVSELSEDLGSFFDVPTEVAYEKIASGLAGMYRPLMQFGVITNKLEMDTLAMKLANVKNTKSLTEAMRANALFYMIEERKNAAMGDSIRTMDSFTNQMKGMKGALKDMGNVLGTKLIPELVPFVKSLTSAFKWIGNLGGETIKWTLIIMGLLIALGPVIWIIGSLATALAFLFSWTGVIIIGIGLFIGLLVFLYKHATKIGDVFMWMVKWLTPAGWAFTLIGKAVGFLADKFAPIQRMVDGFKQSMNDFIASPGGKIAAWFGMGMDTDSLNRTEVEVTITTKDGAGVIDGVETNQNDRRPQQRGQQHAYGNP
jgi:hypothetical protein